MKAIRMLKIRLKSQWMYRLDTAISLSSTLIQIAGILLYWTWATGKTAIAMDVKTIGWYYVIVFCLDSLLSLELAFEVEEDIAMGKMHRYMVLPMGYATIKFTQYLAERGGAILLLVAVTLLYGIWHQLSLWLLLYFFLLVFLAIIFWFFLGMVFGLLTIWLEAIDNLLYFLGTFIALIAGAIIPLSMLPEALHWMVYNPFALSLFAPTMTLLQQQASFHTVILLLVWVVLMYGIYRFVLPKAEKRYAALGG